ncbi:mitochondrial 37S ribosomal protein uS9m [Kwoniella pini CBS 10737]|uniref:Ribosomal protein S9 n=1 Tax=Kwoniella pini CBS 10737 TaxID=1296096 RepID=A0A1B9I4D1_9TREE|nr:uncharacterized protein I206_03699 [Kwoniella pini CBS 10737]OCF50378.1 hypothetical protein I206_03699 [Kwoniella pini CBS 10737]
MSLPIASSSIRSLRSIPLRPIFRSYASLTPYSPPITSDYTSNKRPNRPNSSEFFTGRPKFNESLNELKETINLIQKKLRKKFVYPLPNELPNLNPPQTNWLNKEELSNLLDIKLKTNTLRQVIELLNELNHLRYISELSEQFDLVKEINIILNNYERLNSSNISLLSEVEKEKGLTIKEEEELNGIDEFGRSYSMGRKKTSSSRIWLIPSNKFREIENSINENENEITNNKLEQSQVLINHIPLSQYFIRPSDRETILRPLKITGYLGAFNIFGFSRGGGMSSQASSVGLAIARALSNLKDDAKDILQADGALMRDTRTTERKKTGRAKARKGYTWVKR